MRPLFYFAVAAFLVISSLCVTSSSALAADDSASRTLYRYTGELVDEGNRPISGVFMLTFSLHRQEDDRDAFFRERRWVAVSEGQYEVLLGEIERAAAEWAGQEAFISVRLGENDEFLRHRYTPELVTPPRSREEVIAELEVTYADIAENALRAVEASIAEDCQTIGGLTLEEIDRYDEVLEQIVELERRVEDATGARLGNRTTTLERIGGSGGNSYSRSCPPGHVVTGARGGAGALIDSIELLCSPLQ